MACVAAACLLAACGTTGSSSSSSNSTIKVTGRTLSVYVSDPAAVRQNPSLQDVVNAEQLAFEQHRREVTDYHLRVGLLQAPKVSDNARDAIQDTTAIAYLGEIEPGQSDNTVGITNGVDLLQVSPTDTALELGQSTPAVPGAPHGYFESWSTYGRNFGRVVPNSAQEANVLATEMKALGVKSLYVANDGSDYGRAVAGAVRAGARGAGISLGSSQSGADGIFYGARSPGVAATFFNNAAQAAAGAKLFGTSALDSPALTGHLSSKAAANLYITLPGFMTNDLNAEGQKFVSDFQAKFHHAPSTQAIFGYEAMSVLLSSLRAAGHGANDRTTVTKAFLATEHRTSPLGTYSIDSGSGNTSLDAFVIARPEAGKFVPTQAAPTQG